MHFGYFPWVFYRGWMGLLRGWWAQNGSKWPFWWKKCGKNKLSKKVWKSAWQHFFSKISRFSKGNQRPESAFLGIFSLEKNHKGPKSRVFWALFFWKLNPLKRVFPGQKTNFWVISSVFRVILAMFWWVLSIIGGLCIRQRPLKPSEVTKNHKKLTTSKSV